MVKIEKPHVVAGNIMHAADDDRLSKGGISTAQSQVVRENLDKVGVEQGV